MHSALVGRYNEHTVSFPQLRKTLGEQVLQLRKQIAVDAARGTEEAHVANSTFFVPGAKTAHASRRCVPADEAPGPGLLKAVVSAIMLLYSRYAFFTNL